MEEAKLPRAKGELETELPKQWEYCKKHNLPFFAPADGKCFWCGMEIEDNGKELLTGCPHCHTSWCD